MNTSLHIKILRNVLIFFHVVDTLQRLKVFCCDVHVTTQFRILFVLTCGEFMKYLCSGAKRELSGS